MSTAIPVLPTIQFLDANGDPLAGGKLYTYETGTTTPLATFTDEAGLSPNTNPIILDANGRATIRITSGDSYRFRLDDANDVLQFQADDITSVSGLISSAGALAAANNLSDLTNVATALVNLGIDPLSVATSTAITNSMGATNITGYSFTPGQWVHIDFFITRNSNATLGKGSLDLLYNGASWEIVEGDFNVPSGGPYVHGLTFSMSGNQLQVAADASGNGTLITKYHAA